MVPSNLKGGNRLHLRIQTLADMDAIMTMTKCASSPRLTRNPHTYSKYAFWTVAIWQQLARFAPRIFAVIASPNLEV
jgi:hypothetical protein